MEQTIPSVMASFGGTGGGTSVNGAVASGVVIIGGLLIVVSTRW